MLTRASFTQKVVPATNTSDASGGTATRVAGAAGFIRERDMMDAPSVDSRSMGVERVSGEGFMSPPGSWRSGDDPESTSIYGDQRQNISDTIQLRKGGHKNRRSSERLRVAKLERNVGNHARGHLAVTAFGEIGDDALSDTFRSGDGNEIVPANSEKIKHSRRSDVDVNAGPQSASPSPQGRRAPPLRPSTSMRATGDDSAPATATALVVDGRIAAEANAGGDETQEISASSPSSWARARISRVAGCDGGSSRGEASPAGHGVERGRPLPPSLRTLGSLPILFKPHASYAEAHNDDISAEINALATVSAADVVDVKPRFFLDHESGTKLGWNILMMCLILFSSFANPLQIGGLLVFEVVVDFIFMFDVGLSFRTTVVDPSTKETVTDVRKISARYLRGWFVVDALSSLPLVLLSILVNLDGVQVYLLGLKLLRTLKLHQLSIITNAVLERFEDKDFNPAVFRIYIFVLAFVLVVHFIACGYWAISRITDPFFEGSWTPEDHYLDASTYLKYIRSVYFSLAITYGNDLKPENDAEYMFSNICLTLALLTNAVIIGSATTLLSNMDAGAMAKKDQLDGIKGYMRFRKVPPSLQKKIRTYYEYLWSSGQDKHSSGLFEEMPEKLKLQLNIALKKRLIEKVPLFKTCSPAGIIALVQNLIPSIILPGELIVRQGEPATSMFLISRGTVRVFVVHDSGGGYGAEPAETYIISLGDGSFFGEIALLKEQHIRTANIRAETFTELQVMHGEDFRALAEVFPEFQAAVAEISKSRMNASDALGKGKTRGKFSGREVRSSRAPSPRYSGRRHQPDLPLMRQAGACVIAQNMAERNERTLPKLRRIVSTLMDVVGKPTGRRKAPVSLTGAVAASRFARSPSRMFSFGSPYNGMHGPPETVYETIVAHEETLSHETAMRMTRGGGIHRDTLRTMQPT